MNAIVKSKEEIEFSVEIVGRMSRIIAEFHREKVETRWTTKAVLNWWYHDHERLHDEQYKLAEQLAGKEYSIVGTGNRLWLTPAPEQEQWVKWQRKQPEEAILTISFGKITGNNGEDRLIRGHAKVEDRDGNELIHVAEIYDQVTQGKGSERMRLLKLAKAEMEKTMKCELCDRGQVFYKNVKKMKEQQFEQVYDKYGASFYEDLKNIYLVTWYPVELNEYGLCDKCFVQEQVWRNSTVETDIPTDEKVTLRNQLDEDEDIDPSVRSEVTDSKRQPTLDRLIHMEDRLKAYDDIEFIASLDRHATNEHLGTGSSECKDEHWMWVLSAGVK